MQSMIIRLRCAGSRVSPCTALEKLEFHNIDVLDHDEDDRNYQAS